MPASEQLKSVAIDDIEQTEYKIIDLKSDTKYIIYLLAVTVVDGQTTFVEDSTNILGGMVNCYLCYHIDAAIILSMFLKSLH